MGQRSSTVSLVVDSPDSQQDGYPGSVSVKCLFYTQRAKLTHIQVLYLYRLHITSVREGDGRERV